MKKITPTLISAICCIASFAQTIPQQQWVQTFNGFNNLNDGAFVVGVDGSICVSGISETIPGVFKITTVKYDKNGALLWSVLHNTPGMFPEADFANDIKLDNAGNVYLAASVAIGPAGTDKEFTTIKYDSLGVLQWAATHADTGEAYSLALDGSGNAYVTGWTKTGTPAKEDFTTVKYNSNGVQQWSVKYDGGDADIANSIKLDGSAQIYITGANRVASTNRFNHHTVKYNNGGVQQWAATFTNGSFAFTGAEQRSVVTASNLVLSNGDVFITGAADNGGMADYVTIKYNTSGVQQWIATFNGKDYISDLDVLSTGQVMATGQSFGGSTDADFVTIQYDATGGSQNWLQSYNGVANGADRARGLDIDNANNIYVTGVSSNGTNNDFATVKYSPAGIEQWDMIFNGVANGNDEANDIGVDATGNVYVVGLSFNGSNFDYATVKYGLKEVFQPLDFNLVDFGVLEIPSPSHVYYANSGQLIDTDGNQRRDIKLYTINSSPAVYVTDTSVSYLFASVDTIPTTLDTLHRVDMKLVGANPAARIFKTEQAQGYLNYYLAHIPQGITNVGGFNRAVCPDVYPNIDMQLYSNSEGMKYYFIVHPGGVADNIVVQFNGASSVDVTADGGLRIETILGTIEFEAGHAYQINPSVPLTVVPMPWQAKFVKVGSNQVKFDIHKYPKFKPLIIQVDRGHKVGAAAAIDNLEFSSYWGGVEKDFFTDIKSDINGNMFLTGYTYNLNFPSTTGLFVDSINASGDPDALLIKLNNICEPEWVLIYGGDTSGTGQGGTGHDIGNGLAVNNSGQVYVTGFTASIDFPLFKGNNLFFDSVNGCFFNTSCWDIFIIKLNSATGIPIWASFYGANNVNETASDIAIDGNENVYIVGHGDASATPFQPQAGASNFNYGNGLILKFSQQDSLLWANPFGTQQPSSNETINAIYIDAASNIYICGTTVDPIGLNIMPIVNPGVNASYSGGTDGFFAKFDNNDSLITSTFIGGADDDIANGITTDPSGRIYIIGTTVSLDFPTQNIGDIGAYYVDTLTWKFATPENDAFVMQLDNNGQLVHSTYWGGFSNDMGIDIIAGNDGLIYIGGNTESDSGGISYFVTIPFPAIDPPNVFIQPHMKGGPGFYFDGFLSAITPSFKIVWTTYFGGDSRDELNAIHADNSKLYIAGLSQSSGQEIPLVDFNNASTIDYFQGVKAGSWEDGFVARFDLGPIIILSADDLFLENQSFTIYPNPSTGNIYIRYQSFDNATISIFDLLGRNVFSQYLSKRNHSDFVELDVTNFGKGIYILRIESDHESLTGKFVIE